MPTGLNQLIWIQEELNVKSLADVMRSGLKLINYALKMRNEGWKLILEKDGKFKEIYFK